MRELFRQVSDPRAAVRTNRFSALPVSILVHVLVLLAVVVIPLLASDILPAVRGNEVIYTPVVVPPTPPPPLVAAVHRAAMPSTDSNAAPVVSPSGVGRERGIVSEPVPDAAAPQGVVDGSVPNGLSSTIVIEAPPAVRPPVPVYVHTLLRPPVKVRDVAPVYPETARVARVQGTVIIEAIIGPTGDVIEARVLRPQVLLDQAALEAVKQWKYTPSLLNGVPVPVIMTVTVTFTLR